MTNQKNSAPEDSRMTIDAMKSDLSPINNIELVVLQNKIVAISQQLDELQDDIRFIKNIFLAKQAKKARRRRKKEQERLQIAKAEKAKRIRSRYEEIIQDVRHHPWRFMPAPKSDLSSKEFEVVSLLARYPTEQQVAEQMNIKEHSIGARISAIKNRLGLASRDEVIKHFLEYQEHVCQHRHRRCQILLSWLLHPPPGFIRRHNLELKWKRTFGRGRMFRYAGIHVPLEAFNRLRPYEHGILKLKIQGLSSEEIAERIKIKPTTVKSYIAEIRMHIKWDVGKIIADDLLLARYKDYLKTYANKSVNK